MILDTVQSNWTVYSMSMPDAEEVAMRGPGRRAGLDRAAVVAAGRDALRDAGASGLSMRGVARRLGVAPNALYSHVGNRGELLDLVLDDVLGSVPVPTEDRAASTPVEVVRDLMLASYDVLVDHAELVPHFLARQGARGEHARGLGEVMLAALGHAGLDSSAAQGAMRLLIVNTIGFAAFAVGGGDAGGPVEPREVRAQLGLALDWLLAGALRDGGGGSGQRR